MSGSHPGPRPGSASLRLVDGRMVLLRDLQPGDGAAVRRAFQRADGAGLRARFGGAAPSLSVVSGRVKSIDGHKRYAAGGFAPDGQLIAVAEYVQTDPEGPAEIAVIVAPAWQRHGIGTALLRRLAGHAIGEGITTVTALVSGSNGRVLELVRDIEFPHTITYDHGAGDLRVELAP